MITLKGFLSFSQISTSSAKQDLQYECSIVHINYFWVFTGLLYNMHLPAQR